MSSFVFGLLARCGTLGHTRLLGRDVWEAGNVAIRQMEQMEMAAGLQATGSQPGR